MLEGFGKFQTEAANFHPFFDYRVCSCLHVQDPKNHYCRNLGDVCFFVRLLAMNVVVNVSNGLLA